MLSMQVIDSDHVKEIDVTVRKIIQETTNQLDEKGLHTLVSDFN